MMYTGDYRYILDFFTLRRRREEGEGGDDFCFSGTTYILDVGFRTFVMVSEGGPTDSKLEDVVANLSGKPFMEEKLEMSLMVASGRK